MPLDAWSRRGDFVCPPVNPPVPGASLNICGDLFSRKGSDKILFQVPPGPVPSEPGHTIRGVDPGGAIEPTRKRRRDFEENREAILDAADAAFTELGAQTSIGTIAERAGVGAATVYRHFPNRAALVDAVYGRRFEAYTAAIVDSASVSDPTERFRAMVHGIVLLQARDRSFRQLLGRQTEEDTFFEDPRLLKFGVELLTAVQNARSSGVFREGVREEDVMLLLTATEGVARPVGSHSPDALARFVDLALDGICERRVAPHGEPVDWEGLLVAARG